MIRYLLLLLIGVLLFPVSGLAQLDLGTWFSDSLFQKSSINPAHKFSGNFTVSLPNAYFEINQQGPKYGDIVEVNSEGITTINISNTVNSAKENNFYRSFLNVGTIGFGFNAGNSSFTFNHGVKLLAFLSYPKEFVDLYANGNAQFVGQTISIGPDFQVSLLHELALGYSFGNSNFRIGGRVKFLSGLEDVSVKNDRINLFTNEDIYQLEFNNNYLINTSSLLNIEDLSDITFDYDGIDYFDLFSPNNGVAFDLGAEVFFDNGAKLSASIIDIGKISWKENVTNYHSTGEIIFNGIDIVDVIRDTSEILLLDSLYDVLEFQESNVSYSTSLPLKIYLGFSHDINDVIQLSYLYFLQNFNGRKTHAIAVNSNFRLSNTFLIGANYQFRNDNAFNLGIQSMLKLGPIQLFASTGNILGMIRPKSNSFTSAKIGLNLVF
jgi:hypothetical protein